MRIFYYGTNSISIKFVNLLVHLNKSNKSISYITERTCLKKTRGFWSMLWIHWVILPLWTSQTVFKMTGSKEGVYYDL